MKLHGLFLLTGLLLASTWTALAQRQALALPAIFGDHMVLQSGINLPVWGVAPPGQTVNVTIGTITRQVVASPDGTWRVRFAPFGASRNATTLSVKAGTSSEKFTDVLIGDVWLCSGQSNMALALTKSNTEKWALAHADNPQLRLFVVPQRAALAPQTDVQGQWVLCTPRTAAGFSAVGYYFGSQIQSERQYPVGLIGSYFPGTGAQAWINREGLENEPVLAPLLNDWQTMVDNHAINAARYPSALSAWQAAEAVWQNTEGVVYAQILALWNAQAQLDESHGVTPPHVPPPDPPEPVPPVNPNGDQNTPTGLYNAMIAPLIPYGIKGVIWYQGESNVPEADYYSLLFHRLIFAWRLQWDQGNFPFLFVQISTQATTDNQLWPYLREAQMKTLDVPDTAMVVSVDIGDRFQLHPPDKIDVGDRLALAANHVAYGENLVFSGPLYRSMQILNKNSIRLTFSSIGQGLTIGVSPWLAPDDNLLSASSLVGFTIAGADHIWYPASVYNGGNYLVASSPSVPRPIAVRYEWADAPRGNLYNIDGLPASPFRTDDWPILPSER